MTPAHLWRLGNAPDAFWQAARSWFREAQLRVCIRKARALMSPKMRRRELGWWEQ